MNVEELVSALTLEEKAGLCSGADFWHTKAVERLGMKVSLTRGSRENIKITTPFDLLIAEAMFAR